MDWSELIRAARAARERAHAPYSGFAVGAAVATADGGLYAGCNVENRAYGLTICAERNAVAAAVAAGASRLSAVAVIADARPPATPCGSCREVLAEFADGDLEVLLENLEGERALFRLAELLPQPFVLPGSDD